MGLNTGLLDGDALAEALIMVLNEGRSEKNSHKLLRRSQEGLPILR